MRNTIDVKDLPKGGPYSHAVISGDLIFVSGQTGFDGKNGSNFESQFRNAMDNVSKIVRKSGKDVSDIVKVNVYLADGSLFGKMNELFGEYFNKNPPARTTLVTGFVNPQVKVEIDVIVAK